MMKFPQKTRRFTLIEIIICLTIMAAIGGFATMYGFRTYKQFVLERSVERLSDEILFTKVLATTHQMDITLHFTMHKDKLVLVRKADYVPPKAKPHFNHPIYFPSLKLPPKETYTFYANNPTSFEFGLDLK